jgi:HSP20 family protein
MQFGLKKRDNTYGSEIDVFRRSISDLFDDFFTIKPGSMLETDWVPSIDVHEDTKGIYVKAEIPGMDEKNIDLNIDNNYLTIKGEKTEEWREGNDKRSLVTERRFGSFQRTIRLPEGINTNKVKADFKNGVLTIDIPKNKEEEPKKIKINVK